MRQESEIFTTTIIFSKRTIRITTNMVGPHNFFFVFLLEDFLIFFFFFTIVPLPRSLSRVLHFRPVSFLSANTRTPQILQIVQSTSFLFGRRPLGVRPRFFTWRGWCSWRRCFLLAELRRQNGTLLSLPISPLQVKQHKRSTDNMTVSSIRADLQSSQTITDCHRSTGNVCRSSRGGSQTRERHRESVQTLDPVAS